MSPARNEALRGRGPTRGRRGWLLAALIFAATAVAFTSPGLLPGKAMGGFDIWAFASPFRETTPQQLPINNPLQTDQMEQIPLVAEFWDSARAGDLQLWEPDHAAGTPLLTAVYTRVLAPPNLAYAVMPSWKAAGVAVALALFLGQLGTFGLARRLGISFAGALLAGVAYGFSGPMTALLLRIHETAMLPWVLLGVHACFTSARPRMAILTTAIATVGTLLSGFPAATLHVLYFAVAFALWLVQSVWRHNSPRVAQRGALRLAAGGLGGALLTAPVLLPTAEWLPTTGSIERSFDVTHALGLDRMATAVAGRFFGTRQDGDFWLPHETLANPVEASMTMGAVVLLLLMWLAWSSPRRGQLDRSVAGFLAPAGIAVLVAVVLGGPLLGLIHQLPFMSSNAFGRARFISALVIALMAGIGLDQALGRGQRGPGEVPGPPEKVLRWAAATVLVMVGTGLYLATSRAISAQTIEEVALDLIVPAGCALLATTALVVARRHWPSASRDSRPTAVVSGITILALAVELQVGAWGFVSTAPRELFYPAPDLPSQVSQDVGPNGAFRFTGTTLNILPPHAAGLMDLADLRISFPAYEPWRELLEVADPRVYEHRRLRTVFTDSATWDSPVFDRLATRYVFHPMRDALLDVEPADVSADMGSDLSWQGSWPTTAPVRGVVADINTGDCEEGWVMLKADGETVSRRLARETRGRTVFPVADIDEVPSMTSLVATDCPLAADGDTVRYLLARGSLRVISTDGLVIYERPEARPRADIAETVVTLDEAEEVLEGVGRLPATTALVTEDVQVDDAVTGDAAIRRQDPDHVVIETQTDGRALVVLRDVAAPGWQATVDGEPAQTIVVDHALRGVVVPAGQHEVVFRYWPNSLRVGLWLAAFGVLILAAGLVLPHRALR